MATHCTDLSWSKITILFSWNAFRFALLFICCFKICLFIYLSFFIRDLGYQTGNKRTLPHFVPDSWLLSLLAFIVLFKTFYLLILWLKMHQTLFWSLLLIFDIERQISSGHLDDKTLSLLKATNMFTEYIFLYANNKSITLRRIPFQRKRVRLIHKSNESYLWTARKGMKAKNTVAVVCVYFKNC